MERWLKNSPASGNGRAMPAESGRPAYIPEEFSVWMRQHRIGDFLYFNIPDAGERLWLVSENSNRALEKELQDSFLTFFRYGKCSVRMRELGTHYVFLLSFFNCTLSADADGNPTRSVVVLNRRNGLLQLSDCHQFWQRAILSAFNSYVGGIRFCSRYDLSRLLWELPAVIPENWPLLKIELKQYSIQVLDAEQKTLDVSMRRGSHWQKLRQELCSSDGRLMLKSLGVKVTFPDHATRSYRILEDQLESHRGDQYRKVFEAFLALISVEELTNE